LIPPKKYNSIFVLVVTLETENYILQFMQRQNNQVYSDKKNIYTPKICKL